MAATQKAIVHLGYKIDSIDRDSFLINFKTGTSWRSWAGQEMSALFVSYDHGGCEVQIAGKRNHSIQLYDWGESSAIASKVIKTVLRFLPSIPDAPAANQDSGSANLEKFRVVGVDRKTQNDTYIVIEASTKANAKVKAELKGLIVTEIRRAD